MSNEKQEFIPDPILIQKNKDFLKNSDALFKYMPFSSKALKIIINSTLWFGEVETQNDPFEGEFNLDKPSVINDEDITRLLKFIPEEYKTMSDKAYRNSPNHSSLIDAFKETIVAIMKRDFGICSFCDTYTNNLLWSLYSDKHKGLCFVFDNTKLETLLSNFMIEFKEINYDPIPDFCIDFPNLENFDSKIYNILEYKRKDYVIEKESRYIYHYLESSMTEAVRRFAVDKDFRIKKKKNPVKINRNLKFDPGALKAIIFGLKMSLNDQQSIVNLVKRNILFKNVTIFSAEKDSANMPIKITCPEETDHKNHWELFEDLGANYLPGGSENAFIKQTKK